MRLFQILILSGFLQPAFAQNRSLNFETVWEQVKEFHPNLKSSKLRFSSAMELKAQSALRPNPTLEFEIEEFGGNSGHSGFQDALFQLSFSQPIERKGERGSRIERAQIDLNLEKLQMKKMQFDLFYKVRGQYIKVHFNFLKEKLEKELLSMHNEFYLSTQKLVKYGKASPLALTRAEINKDLAQLDLERAQMEYKESLNHLSSFYGNPGSNENYETIRPVSNIPLDLARQFNSSLHLKIHKLDILLARVEIKKQKAISNPEREYGVGIQRFEGNQEHTFLLKYGFSPEWNNDNQKAVRASEYRLKARQEDARAKKIALHAKAAHLFRECQFFEAKIVKLKKKILPNVKLLHEKTLLARTQGKANILELIYAQKNLIEANRKELLTRRQLALTKNSYLAFLIPVEVKHVQN